MEPRSHGSVALTALLGGVPGMLAGIHVAALLFFLNPRLPFAPRPFLEAAIYFVAVLGAVSAVAVYPFTRGRVEQLRRWLPVALTVVLTVDAVAYWSNAYYFGLFLPAGIVSRLLKAAIWLSLGALICFYTVWVHRLQRRPYGVRSLALFLILSSASIYVVLERRDAFRPRPSPEPRAGTFAGAGRQTLAVVGIDAATLDAVLPLAERGQLPFLDQLRQRGAVVRLETLKPPRRAPLWTTLATGRHPEAHGIRADSVYDAPYLDDDQLLRLLPVGVRFETWGARGVVRPIDARDLESLQLWRILGQLGWSTATIGWPVTSPIATDDRAAEHLLVADRFFGGFLDAVTPQAFGQRAQLFRPPADDILDFAAGRFGRRPNGIVLESLADDRWRQDLSLYLLEREQPPEAIFVALPGLRDIAASSYGGYTAVQLRGLGGEEAVAASRRVTAYYSFLDAYLARLWEAMPPPRLLAVLSPHGAAAPSALGGLLETEATEGTFRGQPDGMFLLLAEDGLAEGIGVQSATLVDVVPTLLYALGLPTARDLDGAVMTDLFDRAFLARRPLVFVPSFDNFRRPTGSLHESVADPVRRQPNAPSAGSGLDGLRPDG
ncbi:MAG: alkaline phosphatase family protein [Acidobacteriota bacterium]